MKDFSIKILLLILIGYYCFGQKELKTTYQIVQNNGKYVLQDTKQKLFFPIGLNHLNIHETQKERKELQGLSETNLNQALYDSLVAWNFNCSGYDRVEGLNSKHSIYHYVKTELLYIASYHYPKQELDVFAPETYARFDSTFQTLVRYSKDPNVIGLLYSDIPLFLPRDSYSWVNINRNLPKDAPGRIRYNQFLMERYANRLTDFNVVYGQKCKKLENLKELDFNQTVLNLTILTDDRAFVNILYDQYLSMVYSLHKKYVPNLLFFGDVFDRVEWTEEMMRTAGKYVDAIGLQPSKEIVFDKENVQRIYELTGKPILITDHKISFEEKGYDKIQGLTKETELESGKAYEDYLVACFENPYIIGFNRCMFKSKWRPGGVLKQGLLNYSGTPYPILIDYVKKANAEILSRMDL